jgi:hypothetical protein
MRVRLPPPSITAPLQGYLQELASALNGLPNVSAYTGTTPEGRVIGTRGDLAIEMDSVYSVDSSAQPAAWWVNLNAPGVESAVSWHQVRVL